MSDDKEYESVYLQGQASENRLSRTLLIFPIGWARYPLFSCLRGLSIILLPREQAMSM
jgi:hypothetical protein